MAVSLGPPRQPHLQMERRRITDMAVYGLLFSSKVNWFLPKGLTSAIRVDLVL